MYEKSPAKYDDNGID